MSKTVLIIIAVVIVIIIVVIGYSMLNKDTPPVVGASGSSAGGGVKPASQSKPVEATKPGLQSNDKTIKEARYNTMLSMLDKYIFAKVDNAPMFDMNGKLTGVFAKGRSPGKPEAKNQDKQYWENDKLIIQLPSGYKYMINLSQFRT